MLDQYLETKHLVLLNLLLDYGKQPQIHIVHQHLPKISFQLLEFQVYQKFF